MLLETIARALLVDAWLVGLAWSWHAFVQLILPIALDRWPWGEDPS